MSKRSRRIRRRRAREAELLARKAVDEQASEAVWILSRRIEAALAVKDAALLRRLAVAVMRLDPRERTPVMRQVVATEIALRYAAGREQVLERGRELGLVPPIDTGKVS